MKFSIIIPAYKAWDFIEECIDSVDRQTLFRHSDYEIILGIDGCKQTYSKATSFFHRIPNLKLYFMPKNEGVYVALNTLISKAQYDNIVIFGADDVMKPEMMEEISARAKETGCDILRFKYTEFNKSMDDPRNKTIGYYSHGSIYLKKKVFIEANGFRDWICSGDTEFLARVEKKFSTVNLNKSLFYRRIHPNALTQNPDTNHQSELRKQYMNIVAKVRKERIFRIDNMVVNQASEYRAPIMVSVCVPIYMMDWVAKFVFLGLTKQKVDFAWELIVIQEKAGAFNFSRFIKDLNRAGCINIRYTELDQQQTIGWKILKFSELAIGKAVIYLGADDHPHEKLLSNVKKAIVDERNQMYQESRGFFYCIENDITLEYIWDRDKHPCGLNKAYSLKLFKMIDSSICELKKNIDSAIYTACRPNKIKIDEEIHRDGFFTDGYNKISISRAKFYLKPVSPFYKTDYRIEIGRRRNKSGNVCFNRLYIHSKNNLPEWIEKIESLKEFGFYDKVDNLKNYDDKDEVDIIVSKISNKVRKKLNLLDLIDKYVSGDDIDIMRIKLLMDQIKDS